MAFPTASPLRFDFAIASPPESNVCTVCTVRPPKHIPPWGSPLSGFEHGKIDKLPGMYGVRAY